MSYAAKTKVPVEKTQMEINKIVSKHGAKAFSYGTSSQRAIIQFEKEDRIVRFILPLPQLDDFKKIKGRYGWEVLNESRKHATWEQATRQRWRALKIAIQAKLEAVAAGITEFEQEFFAHVVDPLTGQTIYELVSPQLKLNYTDAPRAIGLPSPDAAQESRA